MKAAFQFANWETFLRFEHEAKSRFYPEGINTPDTKHLFYGGFQDKDRITVQYESVYFPVRADIQLQDCDFSKHSLRT